MQMRKLGSTGIEVAPLIFGGNVFGWTADKKTSFALLDAFLDAGFNAIDTADVYSNFVPGNAGGESETIIGEWMKQRGVRQRVTIITKVGLAMSEEKRGLKPDYVREACEASLRRLQTDSIDVYLAHRADPAVPVEDTLEAFDALIEAGKVRHVGASNYTADQLEEAILAGGHGRARFEVLQPHYNLVQRGIYEGDLEKLCTRHRLCVIPYYALAGGFLTGKYRSKADIEGRARVISAAPYMNERGFSLLDALETVASRHSATLAQVALAWLTARPSITAPIASATSLAQLKDIMQSVKLDLTGEDMAELEAASQ
jgi:aryl-alcohol dehydrogenase-like predicted oxidoreductase